MMPTTVRRGGAWMQCFLWVPFFPGASPPAPPAEVEAAGDDAGAHGGSGTAAPVVELPTDSDGDWVH